MADLSAADLLHCSFCGKSQKQVLKLIAGPGVYICDGCIDLCNEILDEEAPGRGSPANPTDDELDAAARAVNDAVSHLRLLALRRRAADDGPPADEGG